MKATDFLREARQQRTLEALDYYVETYSPKTFTETEVWHDNKGNVVFDTEENANDFAEIVEDLVSGIAFIRNYGKYGYRNWYSVHR